MDASTATRGPNVPRADEVGSVIWPPVEGRMILREALLKSPSFRQETNGDRVGIDTEGWRIQSPARARFNNLSMARDALLEWARAHSAHAGILGGRRCIVLSDDGDQSYRLWQIVRVSPTLRDRIEQAINEDASTAVKALVDVTRALVHARTRWQSSCALPVRIDTVTATREGPRFAELMPYPFISDSSVTGEDLLTFLRGEFACIRDRVASLRQEILAVLALRAERYSRLSLQRDPAACLLQLLLRA